MLFWGNAEESPQQLGPLIAMEYFMGTILDDLLKYPTEDDRQDVILDPHIDEAKLDIVYDQIADYMLQLSRLRFSLIGAVSEDRVLCRPVVAARPVTFDMNELATNTGYPADKFPSAPFHRVRYYFEALSVTHTTHLAASGTSPPTTWTLDGGT